MNESEISPFDEANLDEANPMTEDEIRTAVARMREKVQDPVVPTEAMRKYWPYRTKKEFEERFGPYKGEDALSLLRKAREEAGSKRHND
mgnify:CR=1 FL=1|jgi:hypothetical protein|tara:strand:- start:658 stop:924 length:267 start_codon:yes stop_codon:yes gene_type:complete